MKRLLLLLIATVAIGFSSEAQSFEVQYTYDASGNRIKRKVVEILLQELKSATKDDFLPVEESWGERQVSIFPNPTYGNLKVNITGGEPEVLYGYELYNAAGSMALKGELKQQGDNPIPMQALSPGVYILILRTGEEKLTYKIIKK